MPEPQVTVGVAGLQILKLLVGNPPQTCADLAASLSVSRTAVSAQLDDLVERGLVVCEQTRLPNRGRPRNLYRATEAALALLFADGHRKILPLIWQAIFEAGGKRVIDRVMQHLCKLLAARYDEQIEPIEPVDRLKCFAKLLHDEGVLIEVEADDKGVTIRRRSCPFVTMADKDYAVCKLDVQFFSAVLGCKVRKIACRRKGAPCCVFELAGI